MRDRDDVPYIVIERESTTGMGSFVVGALVGAGLALLFAPQSGKETQEEIRIRANKLRDAAEERMLDMQGQIEERLDGVREGVQARVELVKEAVESGRQAADDARGDMKDRLDRSKAAYRAGIAAAREVASEDEEDIETSDEG